jgi:hypothetical protein
MISKSRLTASSSKPVPQPTVNALVEIADETETIGEALELGRAAANTPGTDGEDAQEGSAEEADTDVAAAEEETCGEDRTQGEAAVADPETRRVLCEEDAPTLGLG